MTTYRLSLSESKLLDEFLASADSSQFAAQLPHFVAGALALIGLFLFVSTTVLALNSLNTLANLGDLGIWMLVSGLIGGAVIIVVGFTILMYAEKAKTRRKLGAIVRKLVQGTR